MNTENRRRRCAQLIRLSWAPALLNAVFLLAAMFTYDWPSFASSTAVNLAIWLLTVHLEKL